MLIKAICVSTFLLVAPWTAWAAERWVPPPAPQVIDGERIVPRAEVFDGQRYILHLPKPEQLDWRQTRYFVEIARDDEQAFAGTLRTTPFVKDGEVVFVTLPKDSAEKYRIEVIDNSRYPFMRVWSGTIDSIEVMAD